MFNNLEGELRKRNITREKMSVDMNMNISTISAKLNNADRFKLAEAFKLRDLYFPNMEIDYLFATEETKVS